MDKRKGLNSISSIIIIKNKESKLQIHSFFHLFPKVYSKKRTRTRSIKGDKIISKSNPPTTQLSHPRFSLTPIHSFFLFASQLSLGTRLHAEISLIIKAKNLHWLLSHLGITLCPHPRRTGQQHHISSSLPRPLWMGLSAPSPQPPLSPSFAVRKLSGHQTPGLNNPAHVNVNAK